MAAKLGPVDGRGEIGKRARLGVWWRLPEQDPCGFKSRPPQFELSEANESSILAVKKNIVRMLATVYGNHDASVSSQRSVMRITKNE